jgi:hypothetical protein
MTTDRRPLPNDRRTRQLYIDAAIKRAQAKARDAKREVDEEGDSDVATLTTVPTAATAVAVPMQRTAADSGG